MGARLKAPKLSRYEQWLQGDLVRCAILGVDPGGTAGAALTVYTDGGHDLRWARTVQTDSLELEQCLDDAVKAARDARLHLVLALEDWGKGGPLGIEQWLGLGAAAGAWKRGAMLIADRARPIIVRSRAVVRVNQRTWRSAIIPEAGTRDANGRFKPYDTKGWKAASQARVLELFGHRLGVVSSDAAEAALLTYYASRDARITEMLPG